MVLMVIVSAVLAILLHTLAKKHNVPRLPPIIGAIAGYVGFILIFYFATRHRIKVHDWSDFGAAVFLNLVLGFAAHAIGGAGSYFAARWWILSRASQKREQPAPQTGRISVDPPEVQQAYAASQKPAEDSEKPKEIVIQEVHHGSEDESGGMKA